jgi:hypothetical protein
MRAGKSSWFNYQQKVILEDSYTITARRIKAQHEIEI